MFFKQTLEFQRGRRNMAERFDKLASHSTGAILLSNSTVTGFPLLVRSIDYDAVSAVRTNIRVVGSTLRPVDR